MTDKAMNTKNIITDEEKINIFSFAYSFRELWKCFHKGRIDKTLDLILKDNNAGSNQTLEMIIMGEPQEIFFTKYGKGLANLMGIDQKIILGKSEIPEIVKLCPGIAGGAGYGWLDFEAYYKARRRLRKAQNERTLSNEEEGKLLRYDEVIRDAEKRIHTNCLKLIEENKGGKINGVAANILYFSEFGTAKRGHLAIDSARAAMAKVTRSDLEQLESIHLNELKEETEIFLKRIEAVRTLKEWGKQQK